MMDLSSARSAVVDLISNRPKAAAGIGLGVVAVIALVGVVMVRGCGERAAPPIVAPQLPINDGYPMVCKACRHTFQIKQAEFATWPMEQGAYKCPKCGSIKTEPDNSQVTPMVEVPGGG